MLTQIKYVMFVFCSMTLRNETCSIAKHEHCVKSVQILSFFWSVFSRILTEYGYLSVFSPNAGKYGPEITPYLDTFQAVKIFSDQQYLWKERSNQAGIYLFRINNGNIKTMCDIALVT